MRFVIDETSWAELAPSEVVPPATPLIAATERLLDLIATLRDRNHTVSKHSSIYRADVDHLTSLGDVVYGADYEFLGRDLRLRLMTTIEQTPNWDTLFTPADVQITLNGRTFDAPSIAAAWEHVTSGSAVACLPLDCVGRHGPVTVAIARREHTVHFVTSDSEHIAFFRDAIEVENADESGFAALAPAAFPALDWAENVWQGLSGFSRPFRDLRRDITQHLAVLNDHGANVFGAFGAHGPDEVGSRLSALGATASDENGRTKRNRDCERDRRRRYRGRSVTFWWHTKLQPNVNRIHFSYIADSSGLSGVVVVGIFTDHCLLLN